MNVTDRVGRWGAVAVIACVALLAIAGAGATVAAQDDGPGEAFPAAYHGDVTVDGEPAPEGATVVAMVDGEDRGSITVDTPGEYGGEPADEPNLLVDGSEDDEGATIEFHVVVDGERLLAAETATWEEGAYERVDLSAESGDEVDAPSPPSNGGGGGDGGDGGTGDGSDDGETSLVLAEIVVEPETPGVGEEVTLSSGDSVAEAGIAGYEWTIDGEAAGDGESVTTSFDETGDHEVELTITDENGETDTATETVSVDGGGDADDGSGDEGDGDESNDDGIPGFGVGAALVALLGAAVAARTGRGSR